MAKIDYIVRYLLIIKKVKDSNDLGIKPRMEEIISYVNEEMEQRGMQTGFSFRTFQRDISNIKTSLGLSIDYDRTSPRTRDRSACWRKRWIRLTY